MKSSPTPPTNRTHRAPARHRLGGGGFTLAEVLAALLLMAIVIPVVMQGMGVASRAGLVGTRKAAAMRVAERVLNEQFITSGTTTSASASGTTTEGDTSYRWTVETTSWPVLATMTEVTARVTFTVQGQDYEVSATTLFPPVTTQTTATTPAQ